MKGARKAIMIDTHASNYIRCNGIRQQLRRVGDKDPLLDNWATVKLTELQIYQLEKYT